MMTWLDIWKQMTHDDRLEAARAFWDGGVKPGGPCEQSAIETLASEHGFRLKSVERLPAEKRAKWLAESVRPRQSVIEAALRRLHLGPRKEMLIRFLDELAIPHKDGAIERQDVAPTAIPEIYLRAAAHALEPQFPTEWRILYFRVLLARDSATWAGLAPIIEETCQPNSVAAVPADGDASGDAPKESKGAHLSQEGPLQLLDDVLMDVIAASVGEQHGALDADAIRELVEQVRLLNIKRYASYFHLGLLDARQARPIRVEWQEGNDERRGWYLTGAMRGLVQQEKFAEAQEIIATHRRAFEAIGKAKLECTPIAVPLMFEVLSHEKLLAVFLGLVWPAAIAETRRRSRDDGLTFMRRLLDEAASLLREQRQNEAKPILEKLSEATKDLELVGDPPDRQFLRDLKRRRAHCGRLTGDFRGAEEILRGLLNDGAGPFESMVLADLGMIACEIKTLNHVRLPSLKDDMAAVATTLERGRELFNQSISASESRAHGEYCLAVLELCGGNAAKATPLLERAIAYMEQRNDIYYGKTLKVLPRAKLYRAYCLAESCDVIHAEHVAELAANTEIEIWKEAPFLLEPVLTFLESSRAGAGATLAARLLPVHPDFLDDVVKVGLASRVPAVRKVLQERAESISRPRKERFQTS